MKTICRKLDFPKLFFHKIIILFSSVFLLPIVLSGCTITASPEDFSKEDLELSPAAAKALNDFLQGNAVDADDDAATLTTTSK